MTGSLVLLGLALSGAAGLVQQVCWIRAATLVMGSTTLAVSTVVAVFFLGLALGSELFGRVALDRARPLRTLALVELAIAALAAAVLPALALADPVFGALYRLSDGTGPALAAGRGLLLAAILLPPTVLMGAALPLVTRRIVSGVDDLLPGVGGAYAVNTLGAVAGCAGAGLVLLPRLGLAGTVAVGVVASGAAAALLAAAARGRAPLAPVPVPQGPPSAPVRPALVAIVAAGGFVALGSEILWTRFLAFLLLHAFETWTLALSVVLVGIVLGSLAVARARPVRRAAWLGAVLVAQGFALLVLMNLPPPVWSGLGGRLPSLALLLLPPALLSGAAFPLAVAAAVPDAAHAPVGVGRLLAANTAGGILGSLVVGFLALPGLGMDATLTGLAALAFGAGVASWSIVDAGRLGGRAPVAAAALAAGFALLVAHGGARLPEDWLGAPDALVDHREGRTATVSVVRQDGALHLKMDGWWQGTDRWGHQAVAAHLPMLLHPRARRVLVVGVGTGQTPARFLLHPVEAVDCVDVEPAVFDLLGEHFDAGWMDDPRVRTVRADGRALLLHDDARWDVISLELGQAFRPGVASFYTVELYARARERLAPDGLLVQFVPMPFLTPELFASLIASFVAVFPEALLWYNTSELLLVGAEGELPDGRALAAGLARPAVRADLDHALWGGPGHELRRPEVFWSGLLAGPAELAALARGARPLHDDDLRLELGTAAVPPSATREVDLLPSLRAHLAPPAGLRGADLDADRRAAIASLREGNLGAIAAEAWSRSVAFLDPERDRAEIAARLARALAANPLHGPTRRLLGELALDGGRPGPAEDHLRAAIDIDPDDVAARRALAVALLAQDRAGPAAHHLREVVARRPDEAEGYAQLGVALARQGHRGPARRAFETALRLAPDHAEARRNLARLEAIPPRGGGAGFHSEAP